MRTLRAFLFLLLLCSLLVTVALARPDKGPDGGNGVFLGEPVPEGSTSPELTAFGAGCSRWLFLYIGGHSELGKTPMWWSGARVARLRHTRPATAGKPTKVFPGLQIIPEGITETRQTTGVTHIALSRISLTGAKCTLTYRWYIAKTGKPIGPSVVLTGSREQILAQLPGAARKLSVAVGVAKPRIPAKTGLTVDEITFLGALPWMPGSQINRDAAEVLHTLAEKHLLAAILYMDTSEYLEAENSPVRSQRLAWVNRLAKGNPLAYGEMGQAGSALYRSQTDTLRVKYPRSYMAWHLYSWANRPRDKEKELEGAIEASRLAPDNPDAWILVARIFGDTADDIRQGRFTADISEDEWKKLSELYVVWTAASIRATELAPHYGKAWLRLATSATFVGEERIAREAIAKAIRYDTGYLEVYNDYSWALQMYQPKWLDDSEEFDRLIKRVAAGPFRAPEDYLAARNLLLSYDKKVLAAEVERKAKLSGFILPAPEAVTQE